VGLFIGPAHRDDRFETCSSYKFSVDPADPLPMVAIGSLILLFSIV
jgi:hypothetical protein